MRLFLRVVVGVVLLHTSAAVAAAPPIEFTADEAFDAATVPAYAGGHDAIYAHIDANLPRHLAELQRWVPQPSVSAQNRGVREMAELLGAGFDSTLSGGFYAAANTVSYSLPV